MGGVHDRGLARAAADVASAQDGGRLDRGNHGPVGLEAAHLGQLLDVRLGDGLPRHRVHDIDDGAARRYGDRFLHASHSHLDVDGRGERRRQLDALPNYGAEPRQGKRERVGPRAQVDNRVSALAVRDDRLDTLDERRARGFDRDARKDESRFVDNGPGEPTVRLGRGGGRKQQEHARDRQRGSEAVQRAHRWHPASSLIP